MTQGLVQQTPVINEIIMAHFLKQYFPDSSIHYGSPII